MTSNDRRWKEVQEKLLDLDRRLRWLERQARIRVRLVRTDKGDRILVEQLNHTWYSPRYFRKLLEGLEEEKAEGKST